MPILDSRKSQGNVMRAPQNPSRRFTSRVAGPPDLWVFWNCRKHEGLSRVLDLSVGGLCVSIEKSKRIVVGEKVHLNFLAPEGQIRSDAIVRHERPEGLGLKFIAISEEDRAHLTALMARLRSLSRPQPQY
jgi:PilZ domain